MWILKPIVILVSIVQWNLFPGVGTRAVPLGEKTYPYNPQFPQQPWVPPERIQDGQSLMDKIFIMKMINYLEWDLVKKRGQRKNFPYLREYIFEGDIILTRQQALSFMYPGISTRRKRGPRRRKRKLDVKVLGDSPVKKWDMPIHYNINASLPSEGIEAVKAAVRHWSEETCIELIEHTDPPGPYLHFTGGEGCYSNVGKIHDTGAHSIIIKTDCFTKGIISHEIGHSLGFWHEHARADRDAYVKINESNIMAGQLHNFQKISWATIDNMALQYDISSVMHYNALEFSEAAFAGRRTIESLDPFLQNSMGQQLELSFYDVKLANKAYCNTVCDPALLHGVCNHDGYQDPRNCSRCRCPEGLSGDFCDTVTPSTGSCGGVITRLDSTNTIIRSPGYPTTYAAGLKCYWLIQSPEGTVIRMKFLEPYMHSRYCSSNREYGPCTDFVEIRTNDNLAKTGGRFCCNDSFQRQRLSQHIYSHANHTLVLFKTMAEGEHGFQLQVSIESCGGCHNHDDDKQRPCFRHVTHPYYQTWFVSENVTSYTNYSYPYVNKLITREENVTKQRQSEISSEEAYCCRGFNLNVEKTSCIVSSAPTTTKETATTTTSNTSTTYSPEVSLTSPVTTAVRTETPNISNTSETSNTEGEGTMTTWSSWSPWTTCSVTCGGCGVQTRRRSCEPMWSICDGEDFESKQCGVTSCDTGSLVQSCARNVTTTYMCGFLFTSSSCTKTETEYYSQPMTCCCGYEVNGDECVKAIT